MLFKRLNGEAMEHRLSLNTGAVERVCPLGMAKIFVITRISTLSPLTSTFLRLSNATTD
jgi:hypothetical protein